MQKLEERNTYTPTDITQVSGNCDRILNREECFVFGRRKTGYFELRKLDGTKIHASAKIKDLTLLETANTLLISYLGGVRSSPDYKSGVSATPTPHGDL